MTIKELEKLLEKRLNYPVVYIAKSGIKEHYFRIFNIEYKLQNIVCKEIIAIEKELNNEFIITPIFYTPEETSEFLSLIRKVELKLKH